MKNILEIARVVRSKNSGPYELVLDVMLIRHQASDFLRSIADEQCPGWLLHQLCFFVLLRLNPKPGPIA